MELFHNIWNYISQKNLIITFFDIQRINFFITVFHYLYEIIHVSNFSLKDKKYNKSLSFC